MMKRFAASLAVMSVMGAVVPAQADTYPDKPVTVIIPFAPGGGVDVLTRAIAAKLEANWHKPVIVQNKPGAGSLVGTAYVARAAPDGYTLLATVNQSMVGNRFLYKHLPYDPDKDFVPITMMVKAEQLIVANKNLPVKTLKDVVALARSKPGTLNYGSYGNGSQPHLLFSMINDREHIHLTHIPYNGITPNLLALAGGDVQLASGSAAVVLPLVQSGKIKPIAVAGSERVNQFPDVSTTTEQGFPYAQISIWYGMFAPAGTPAAVVGDIRKAVQAVLADPQFVKQQVSSKGLNVVAGDGKQLADTIHKETQSTGAMIKAAGVVAE
jgi:tripartite-type tricarboxylate transporter receptor subunit TctC